MKNVLELLECTADRMPDKIAVDDGNKQYSYRQLYLLAKKAGSFIVKKTEPGKPVIVFMEKGADTLIAFLGIVYAGCFYVLVNPQFPEARIKSMLEVLDAVCAITDKAYMEKLVKCEYAGDILDVDDICCTEICECELLEIRRQMTEKDLLYGMFTSGSTGTPKNVVVSHQAVLDFIEDFIKVSGISPEDRIGNQAPFDFDVSVKDIYAAMYSGATLILVCKEMFSKPERLLNYLSEKKVTVLIWAVTALCMAARMEEFAYLVPQSIHKIMFSGEVMPVKQLEIWRAALPDAEFYNLYGPTEAVCNCTWYMIGKNEIIDKKIPIGRPFPKRKIWLLDTEQNEICEPQCVGEICVGGGILASGYYHNENEQNKRFVKNGKDLQDDGLIYCTGDLGYYDAQGLLYFAGRRDYQIKRLGHRIELEEVEAEIGRIMDVEQACCIYDEESQVLAAFYTGSVEAGEIRRTIRKVLPAYMLPNRIICVDDIPANKNGKMDRKFMRERYENVFVYEKR